MFLADAKVNEFVLRVRCGMFGGWLDFERLVDVEQGLPNAQILRITKRPRSPNGYTGSHRVFWDYFYEGCSIISPWVPAALQSTITP